MRAEFRDLIAVLLLAASGGVGWSQNVAAHKAPHPAQTHRVYVGFDKNEYPGDDLLAALHQTFAFTGYWLNAPPGANSNGWAGKRSLIRAQGFGFVLLFNGRLYAQLKGQDAAALGRSDAQAAIASAQKEGFPARAIIFLDQEEGGHLLPEQAAYLGAWIQAIRHSAYRPGVYCSGIAVPAGAGKTTSTAAELRATDKTVALWIANDQCPPAPGCVIPSQLPSPNGSGFADAPLWQYAQAPRRAQFTAQCAATYADNTCYAQGLPHSAKTFLDLNTALSPDPSAGR